MSENCTSLVGFEDEEGIHFCPPILSSEFWVQILSHPNEVLFKTEAGYPISFFLKFKSKAIQKYTQLVESNGGRVELNESQIKPYTVVLVDFSEDLYYQKRVLFKANYLIDCVRTNQLLNIDEYIYNKLDIFLNIDFMNVVYWRTKNIGFERPQLREAKDDCEIETPSGGSNSDDEVEAIMQPFKRPPSIDKHSKRPFSRTEQKKIIKYIISKDGFHLIKGKAFWKEMESDGICPARTFESLRSHFLKMMLPKIENFKEINAQSMKMFLLHRESRASEH